MRFTKHHVCLQILYLEGLKYLYRLHVFLYSMFAFIGLTAIYLSIRGPRSGRGTTLKMYMPTPELLSVHQQS